MMSWLLFEVLNQSIEIPSRFAGILQWVALVPQAEQILQGLSEAVTRPRLRSETDGLMNHVNGLDRAGGVVRWVVYGVVGHWLRFPNL